MSQNLFSNQESRREIVTITKPIVYGNIAKSFGMRREGDGHTHGWTVYLKPYLNEDMSTYVNKVVFKLHESYANPIRTVTQPPYKVSESGWGEFEIVIKIYFNDPQEKAVKIIHPLKLLQNDPEIMAGRKILVSESYDELVFQDPSLTLQKLLNQPLQPQLDPTRSNYENIKQEQLSTIRTASANIKQQIQQVADQLKQKRASVRTIKNEISKINP